MSEAAERTEPLILVADDEPDIRRLVVFSLKKAAVGEIIEAKNGVEALDLMRLSKPNIVVLDLMMPKKSGWDVLEERRQDEELLSIPVVVITANRGEELVRAIGEDVTALLPKPLDIEGLIGLIRSTIEDDAPSHDAS